MSQRPSVGLPAVVANEKVEDTDAGMEDAVGDGPDPNMPNGGHLHGIWRFVRALVCANRWFCLILAANLIYHQGGLHFTISSRSPYWHVPGPNFSSNIFFFGSRQVTLPKTLLSGQEKFYSRPIDEIESALANFDHMTVENLWTDNPTVSRSWNSVMKYVSFAHKHERNLTSRIYTDVLRERQIADLDKSSSNDTLLHFIAAVDGVGRSANKTVDSISKAFEQLQFIRKASEDRMKSDHDLSGPHVARKPDMWRPWKKLLHSVTGGTPELQLQALKAHNQSIVVSSEILEERQKLLTHFEVRIREHVDEHLRSNVAAGVQRLNRTVWEEITRCLCDDFETVLDSHGVPGLCEGERD